MEAVTPLTDAAVAPWQHLARQTALRFAEHPDEREELEAELRLRLCLALREMDDCHPQRQRTFLITCLRYDALGWRDRLPRERARRAHFRIVSISQSLPGGEDDADTLEALIPAPTATPEAQVLAGADEPNPWAVRLWEMAETLTSEQAEVLRLRYDVGLTNAQVAAATGRSEEEAAATAWSAVMRLRKMVVGTRAYHRKDGEANRKMVLAELERRGLTPHSAISRPLASEIAETLGRSPAVVRRAVVAARGRKQTWDRAATEAVLAAMAARGYGLFDRLPTAVVKEIAAERGRSYRSVESLVSRARREARKAA